MKLQNLTLALGLAAMSWSTAAWSQPATTPPPMPPPDPQNLPRAAPPQPPRTTNAEPSTADSDALTTRAANAMIGGDPQQSLQLADQAIAADPRDPWAHYARASSLARLGRTDDALRSFASAEERFAANDVWARSVAMYGRAHALAEAGRCEAAHQEFLRYASFIRSRDPRSADMAVRYAADCKSPPAPEQPQAAPPPSP